MSAIIQGTTPTIKYTFNTVAVADIAVAYLTIKQNGATKIEKALSDATTGDKYIAWTLTQAETLGLSLCSAACQCNWKKSDGTRGASRILNVMVTENYKNEVI